MGISTTSSSVNIAHQFQLPGGVKEPPKQPVELAVTEVSVASGPLEGI